LYFLIVFYFILYGMKWLMKELSRQR